MFVMQKSKLGTDAPAREPDLNRDAKLELSYLTHVAVSTEFK